MHSDESYYVEISLGDSISEIQRQVVEAALEQFQAWNAEGYLGDGVELEIYVGPARISKESRELFTKADDILFGGK